MEGISPKLTIAGLVFDIPTVGISLLVAVIIFLIAIAATRKLTHRVPMGTQNFVEWLIDFVRSIAGQFMDAQTASRFITLALTLAFFIFISNQIGLLFTGAHSYHKEPVPSIGVTQEKIDESKQKYDDKVAKAAISDPDDKPKEWKGVEVHWWKSPTANPNAVFALALSVLLFTHYIGMKRNFKHYLLEYRNPIHILEEFVIKPLTLPLRLFGNIFAGEVLLVFLLGTVWYIASVPMIIWMGYSLFVGSVQTYIFVTLSFVYLSQKLLDHH